MTSVNVTSKRLRRRAGVTVVAVAAAVVSFQPTAYGAAVEASVAPGEDIQTVVMMAPEEYRAAYLARYGKPAPMELRATGGVEVLRSESGKVVVTDNDTTAKYAPATGARVTSLRDPVGTTPWHQVLWSDTDGRGTYIPTRFGNSSLGYSHYSSRHNLTTSAPFRAIRSASRPAVDQGAHVEYQAIAVKTGDIRIKEVVRIVAQAARRTDDGRYSTPDGSNIGTITAYCEGKTKCPSWINLL